MQSIKLVFSLTKLGRDNRKTTGYGFIKDNNLVLHLGVIDGKDKWFVIENYTKYIFPIISKQNEYKGYYTSYSEDTLIPSKNGSYDTRDTETNYHIWFKKLA